MSGEMESIRRLAGALRENLVKCAADPDVDAVHDTRTGTRRLQALLENLVREMPAGEAGERVRDAAKALMRQLKRIRRTAGTVRDLDVHRKLLEKLKTYEKSRFETRAFMYLDVISWLESKIAGVPVQDVIREKFLNGTRRG